VECGRFVVVDEPALDLDAINAHEHPEVDHVDLVRAALELVDGALVDGRTQAAREEFFGRLTRRLIRSRSLKGSL
jgi:hypothetical protein